MKNKDLTVGKPSKVLLLYCLPLLGSVLFQQLYSIADGIIAGKLISENALAAVGNSSEITMIFLAFAFGCNVGASVVVSELFGGKRYSRVKTAVYTAYIATSAVCLMLMLIGMLFSRDMLIMLNTPDVTLSDSVLYLDIYVYGLPFVLLYNVTTGIFTALGDSKTPFAFLAFSSVSNVILNVVFVACFEMGIAGLAWATFVCQGVSCVLSAYALVRRLRSIDDGGKTRIFDSAILKKMSRIAVPSILQQSFISFGNIAVQGVINIFGPGVMAGFSGAIKLQALIITCFTTLGNAISNFTAQNIGAGKVIRVKEGFFACIKIAFCIALPVFLLYFTCGESLMKIFIEDPTADALAAGGMFLKIVSPFFFIISLKLVADGVLRGSGQMGRFMVATFTDLFLRVALTYILSKTALGYIGIWISWPIGWIFGTMLSLVFYFSYVKKRETIK